MVVAVVYRLLRTADQVAGRMSASPRASKHNINLLKTKPDYTNKIDFFWLLN